MRLYVGNLSYSTKEADLREIFGAFGELSAVALISDRDTGRSKGFAFVEFVSADDAQTAMSEMNGKEVDGRFLKINEARPRNDGHSDRPERRSFDRS